MIKTSDQPGEDTLMLIGIKAVRRDLIHALIIRKRPLSERPFKGYLSEFSCPDQYGQKAGTHRLQVT